MKLPHVEAAFPGLKRGAYKKTSDQTNAYNCIAWAAGETHRKWWPDPMNTAHWPPGAPRVESVDAFVKAFESIGYQLADKAKPAKGYERIALYALHGKPKHAAKQLASGKWSSKLGDAEDIEHTLTAIEGNQYGTVVHFMRRPKSP